MALSGKQFDEWSEALDQIVEMMNGIRSRLQSNVKSGGSE